MTLSRPRIAAATVGFTAALAFAAATAGHPVDGLRRMGLLEITLAAPLNGSTVSGTAVTDLGSIPQSSICSGMFEPEDVDYDSATGVLRVEITQPSVCEVATSVYEYQQS
jgi:hypothetical protein